MELIHETERSRTALEFLREFEAETEDRIQSGIEQNRKGYLRLDVKDETGKPLRGVKVRIDQKTHDFRFGANLFMLDELETPEKNETYKRVFAETFNLATLPFYWSDLEPEKGHPRFGTESPRIYRRPTPDLCLAFCEEHCIEPKLHCLNYPQWTPLWVPEDVGEEKRLLDKRIREIAERYRDRIPSMEVTNETLHSTAFPKPKVKRNPTSRTASIYRAPDLVEWSFAAARRYLPANRLVINEATRHVWQNEFQFNRSAYYMQIQRALEKGAGIDSIGFQYHMFYPPEREADEVRSLLDPRQLFAVMDQYADFGLPLQITEVTVPAFSDSAADEELQAKIAETLYRIWFSHPNMEAVIYWNVVDGYAAWAKPGDFSGGENAYRGGLLHFDMTPKPVFNALSGLIRETWHTAEEVTVDESAALKGFYGEYEVTAEKDGKTVATRVHLKKGAKNRFTIVL